jgi:hypothetical protein
MIVKNWALIISCYVLTLFSIHTTSTCIVGLGDICSALRYSNQYLFWIKSRCVVLSIFVFWRHFGFKIAAIANRNGRNMVQHVLLPVNIHFHWNIFIFEFLTIFKMYELFFVFLRVWAYGLLYVIKKYKKRLLY